MNELYYNTIVEIGVIRIRTRLYHIQHVYIYIHKSYIYEDTYSILRYIVTMDHGFGYSNLCLDQSYPVLYVLRITVNLYRQMSDVHMYYSLRMIRTLIWVKPDLILHHYPLINYGFEYHEYRSMA